MNAGQQVAGTYLLGGNNNPYDQFGNFIPPYNQPRPQPQNVYAFVNGIEGAKQYNLLANQSILLMDNSKPVCYLKEVNALGQATIRCFKLVETSEKECMTNDTPNEKTSANVVKNEDFVHLKERVDEIEKKLGAKKFLQDKDAPDGKALRYYLAMKK